MSTPFITVALCTHNHADRLVRTLTDFRQLASPPSEWELLIIDNGCTDGTAEILAADHWRVPGVSTRIVREERLGLSNARNRAIQEARGEYILFMDDDETPDPAWLTAYETAIREFAPDALGGRIDVLFEHGGRPRWLQDELLGFLGQLDHGAACWLTDASTPIFGGNFAFRLEVFQRIGNFDAALGRQGTVNVGGEDTEMFTRLLANGARVRWVPEAVIHHRIQAFKLQRKYFLDLHFREGRTEGVRCRDRARLPPPYAYAQLLRALQRALAQRMRKGCDKSLRLEMNAAYQFGYIRGWLSGRQDQR